MHGLLDHPSQDGHVANVQATGERGGPSLPPWAARPQRPHQVGHVVRREQRLQELSCDVCV